MMNPLFGESPGELLIYHAPMAHGWRLRRYFNYEKNRLTYRSFS